MNVEQLITIISGTLINPTADLSREIKGGCGADLMSDVLASIQPEAVLLTGLCNPQVVRTAQMADVAAIVLVRGKKPPQETIALAEFRTNSSHYHLLMGCSSCVEVASGGFTESRTPGA